MTPRQALTKAKRLLGPKAAVEWNPDAPDAEQREINKAKVAVLLQAKEDAVKARDERAKYLLAHDADYQRLKRLADEAKAAFDRRPSTMTYRANVGTVGGVAGLGFFHNRAFGDTFDECFAKLEGGAA